MNFLSKLKAKLNIKSNKHLLAFALIAVALLTALIAGTVTLARYLSEKHADGLITPEKFYFESNLLTKEGKEYALGTDSIVFDLEAYDDELRSSEVDITYTVSITCDTDNSVTIPEGVNTSGTLMAKAYKTVEYNGLPLGNTYTVTATSQKPYTKTIRATFVLPNVNDAITIEKRADASGLISYLTLKTGNVAKDGIVVWQNGYVPDNSEPIMANAMGTSHYVTLEPNSTYELRFFKSNLSASYNSGDYNFASEGSFDTLFTDYASGTRNNYNINDDITGKGLRYKLKNNVEPSNDYSASGYITVKNYNPGGNSHIQFKFRWTDMRFLFWDNYNTDNNTFGSDGYYGFGYILRDNTDGDGAGKTASDRRIVHYDDNNKEITNLEEAPPHPKAIDVRNGPVTLKWQVVITGGRAYFYVNNSLIFNEKMLQTCGGDLFCVGGLQCDFTAFGVELVAKTEDAAAFNSILENLGIQ